jgi:hypothetical protein
MLVLYGCFIEINKEITTKTERETRGTNKSCKGRKRNYWEDGAIKRKSFLRNDITWAMAQKCVKHHEFVSKHQI